jgi:V/A-type H+-transporting ATPase subunit I
MAIVPMKRVTFVTLAQEGEALLRFLQGMGVIHPEHLRPARETDAVSKLEHLLHVQRSIIRELELISPPEEESCPPPLETPPSFSEAEGWLSERRRLAERLARIDATIERQTFLEDFDPQDVSWLREQGVFVQLWRAEARRFDEARWPSGVVARTIQSYGKDILFVTAVRGEPLSLRWARDVEFPERSLGSLQDERLSLERTIGVLNCRIGEAAKQLASLRKEHEGLLREHDFREALARAFGDESVVAIGAWVPAGKVEEIRRELKSFPLAVVMQVRDPLPDEMPPVLTTNPWIARVFEPMLHLLGMPNYRGLDPALFFAPFMMLFFGICLGDAGYGVLMIAASYVMRRWLVRKIAGMKLVANMTLLLGAATIVWGAITGSFFGVPFEERSWIPLDITQKHGEPMHLFRIAIGLGVIHLTIALLMALLTAGSWGRRLAKLGVVMALWAGVFGVLRLPYWWVLMSLGIALIIGFSAEVKNPLQRLGLGLWSVYGLTGLLGDVMSYARLFGLGLATAAIASVVNVLAGQVREAVPVAGYLLAVMVLLVGHGFNFAMGIVSALVHPARLHAVEAFPKCVELTGAPYKPLQR